MDCLEIPGVRERTDHFVKASLEEGIPDEVGDGFDVIVAADVIEHLSRPGEVLRDMRRVLRPGGQVLLSVPNFAHWYPRIRVAAGMFGYDRRGILDETHLRFFTRATLRRLVRASGFDILEEQATGLPLRAVSESDGPETSDRAQDRRRLVGARPTLFGYQYILRLTPHAQDDGACRSHLTRAARPVRARAPPCCLRDSPRSRRGPPETGRPAMKTFQGGIT